MKLYLNNYDFLKENENEALTDLLSNTILEIKQIVKYLGKYKDSNGNTTNLIVIIKKLFLLKQQETMLNGKENFITNNRKICNKICD